MALTRTPEPELGRPAADFDLPGVDGRRHTLASSRGAAGLLVMFICNHCPYVRAIHRRLVADCMELQRLGIGVVAICSNDARRYPEDGFDAMRETAANWGFKFPYCHDADQSVARAYGAVCTPDFFLHDAELKLHYRGRLDAAALGERTPGMRAELLDVARAMTAGAAPPAEQPPSMGCSIKWAS